MNRNLLSILILLLVANSLSAQYISGLTLNHDGEVREYDLYLPVNFSQDESLPLVFNLHGLGATSISQSNYTGFNAIADTARFIIAYPQGLIRTIDLGQTGTHWNAYFGTDVDDKGFLIKLMDKLIEDYNIDNSRIYATGWSNGGYMAYRLGCEVSERMAAVASVTGTMLFQQLPNCSPSNAVSVLHIHGTEDMTVNYNGSSRSIGVPEVISTWIDNNNCSAAGVQEQELPDVDPNDNSTVTKFEYNSCTLNTDVHLYKITGGGHTWPGAVFDRPELGATNRDINASAVIWEFFRLHRNINTVTDLDDNLAEQTFVYPAVFTSEFSVGRIPEGSILTLYSYAGRKILERTASNPEETFNMAQHHAGIYIMQVQLPGQGYSTFRLVKTE